MVMTLGGNGLVRSFATLKRAEAARSAVLSLGVSPDAVQLQVLQDEAGPVEGNFLVGNGREASDDTSAYKANFANQVARGSCLLVLITIPDDQRSKVEAALKEFGGADVDAMANKGSDASPESI
ncbi:MAG: hypothetical protein EOP12_03270 [Pseudomonas sp.]|nr:MAG: hypothetical protein EOP12_03270 [Pseudomonas sp.]